MKEKLNVCPGTLKEGHDTYSSSCRNKVFYKKKVDHILPYNSPTKSEEDNRKFIDNRKRISISGVQEKLSFTLEKNKLRLTEEGEQGLYILKPIPRDLKLVDQLPANEHLTMQLAAQVYGINTAENALIFFKSGEPAYITKRFDIKEDGEKWSKEDFASLSERTKVSHGNDFKYNNISYEEVAELLKKYVGAYKIEVEKFFSLVVFNFLFSNGDAHLKNFSLLETIDGDYILSPAYDLLNTRLHVADTAFALKKGLFKDGSVKEPKGSDFLKFGKVIGIAENRIAKIYNSFLDKQDITYKFIKNSFLSEKAKKGYEIHFNTKLNILKK